MPQRDGHYCPGCGLPNYEGLCPVCRGDYPGYVEELHPFFGPWADTAEGAEGDGS
jgi:hypothetical protein